MAGNVVPPESFRLIDDPWRRLPVLILGALVFWSTVLFGFAEVLQHPENPPTPKPIDARIVIIPTPPPIQTAHPERPRSVPHHQPKPDPRPRPRPVSRPVPQRIVQVPLATTSPPVPVETPPPEETPAPPEPSPPTNDLPGGGSMGAHAIYQPAPQIPDDLREEAIHTTAVARFHVASDGTTQVELLRATPNPRLNQVILETLKTWKFFPAMTDGKPQDSQVDLRIPIEVN